MGRLLHRLFSSQPRSRLALPIRSFGEFTPNKWAQLFAASILRQVQHYEFSSVRFYAGAQAINIKELGLKALWKHNTFGLSPTIENAHMFLSHARKEKDLDLMKKTLRTMVKNLVMPTAQTADIVIRICKDNGDLKLMSNLADEFLQNGVMLSSSAFDILIATAANFGSVDKVFEAQKLREKAGLDHTMASTFSIAKAHILQGEPQIGVDLIAQHCKDKVKVQKYLTMLVTAWPSELLSRKEQAQIEGDALFTVLKENVILFTKALAKNFRGVWIDAEREFGKVLNKSNEAD